MRRECHVLWCRACGEYYRIAWWETSNMELVAREMVENKDEFEWHKALCQIERNLKEINKNLDKFFGGYYETENTNNG